MKSFILLFLYGLSLCIAPENALNPRNYSTSVAYKTPVEKKRPKKKRKKRFKKRKHPKATKKMLPLELVVLIGSLVLLIGGVLLAIFGFNLLNPAMWIVGIVLALLGSFILVIDIATITYMSGKMTMLFLLIYMGLILIASIVTLILGLQMALMPLWILAIIIGSLAFLLVVGIILNFLFNQGLMW